MQLRFHFFCSNEFEFDINIIAASENIFLLKLQHEHDNVNEPFVSNIIVIMIM